jgi:hypothetical protein
MKAQINLRSTLTNSTTWQRGSAALAALTLLALIGTLLIYLSRPSAQAIPQARVGTPAQRGTMPNFGTGSVYDGGHYVDWQPAKPASPKGLNFGTGSVYDGGHYVEWQPATRVAPQGLNFGTGSVYDGGHYVDW